jgi:hypothetical protein
MVRKARASQIKIDPAVMESTQPQLLPFSCRITLVQITSQGKGFILMDDDDDDVLDLTHHVLPWVSAQALIIGSQNFDNTWKAWV